MIPVGGPYVCRGCGVHHLETNPCEVVLHHDSSELARCSRFPQRDHTGCASSVECDYAAEESAYVSQLLEGFDMFNQLDQLELQIHDARAALQDEDEGNLRAAVTLLELYTNELTTVVRSW